MRIAATFAITVSKFEILSENGERSVVDVDQADDLVAGLQRHRHHASNLVHDDAVLSAQSIDPSGIANQERCLSRITRSRTAVLIENPSPLLARTVSSPFSELG